MCVWLAKSTDRCCMNKNKLHSYMRYKVMNSGEHFVCHFLIVSVVCVVGHGVLRIWKEDYQYEQEIFPV